MQLLNKYSRFLATSMIFFLFHFTIHCGGAVGTSSGTTSSLTYSQTVTAHTTEGLTTYTKAKSLGDAYSSLIGTDPTAEDADDSLALITTFDDAFDDYNTHLETLETYGATTFGTGTSSSLSLSAPRNQSIGSVGIDAGGSLESMHNTLSAKRDECQALQNAIPSITSSNFATAKAAYDACYRELVTLAAEQGLEIVVVQGGGSVVGGATAGAIFLYIAGAGATLVSAPGILAVLVGGVVGSKVASFLYSFCTSDSDSNLVKYVSAGEYCAAASAQGTTDTQVAMNVTGGTGTLHVFIEGYAPIVVENVTITAGQTTTVTVSPLDLNDVTDESVEDVEDASTGATADSQVSTASSCDDIVSIVAENSPADPSPGQTVTVTATVVPAISGCTVSYSVAGTDGYAASSSPSTDSSGQISFTIPGGATGVNDVVSISESDSGVSTTLHYVF